MKKKKWEQCGEEFAARESKQRFCCGVCNGEWWQDERRRALAFYRASQRECEATQSAMMEQN